MTFGARCATLEPTGSTSARWSTRWRAPNSISRKEIEFALIQMKADMLNKSDVALRRIEGDTYGICFECGDEITGARLRALPFAVRCKDCEDTREVAEQRDRVLARRSSSSLFI
jgi:RNA polymerase-binding transcription factor DksA